MRRRRILWAAAAIFAALVLLAAVVVMTLRSPWFYEKVRERLVSTLETATGGRVEIGSFRFDWRRMRAEVTALTLHGLEPADKPPLLRCRSAALGLRIVSVFKHDIDLQYLSVEAPRIYLIVQPDGSTNLPHPKVRGQSNAIESILKLAIQRLDVSHGELTIEARGTTPFEIHGQSLTVALNYEAAGPRYRGNVSIQPLEIAGRGGIGLRAAITMERNRIGIQRADVTMGGSRATVSGAIEDILSPHGVFRYEARVNSEDAARILRAKLLDGGTAQSAGTITWRGHSDFQLAGSLHAYGLDYHDAHVRLHHFQAEGALAATPQEIRIRNLRFSGHAAARSVDLPVSGQAAEATLRDKDLTARGIALTLLGGTFRGEGTLSGLERYSVQGEIAGFDTRRALALYSKQTLPWDALVSGAVKLQGVLNRPAELVAGVTLTISPAPGSAPVQGQLQATYDARSGILDLGHSTLSLPSSTATVSGAIGRELQVHLQSSDLDDLLPILGQRASGLPLKLQSTATFDGTLTGKLDDPRIAGTLAAGRFAYQGREFDGFSAAVTASPQNLQLTNASLQHGALRAQFQFAVGLVNWKPADDSQIFGGGSIQSAPLSDLAALAGQSIPVSGTLNGSAQVKGTVSNPLAEGEVTVTQGAIAVGAGEPFDRFSARLSYANNRLQMLAGQLTSGAEQVNVTADYVHQPNDFTRGKMQFQAASNSIALAGIRDLQQQRPGVSGTVQVNAHGTIDFPFRIEALNADISARDVALDGQALGNLHLTAQSQGAVLNARLDSDFASSVIKGEGQWRLEGDYPGTANITFGKLDFAQLRRWLSPVSAAGSDLTGYTAGTLRLEGPGLKPQAIRAELRLTEVQIGIPPAGLTLTNSGPMVATIANSTATIQSARLTGRNTDLTIAGKIALQGKSALDVRATGRIDLAIVHDWNADFTATGVLDADASVRGPLSAPQVSGRVSFQRASFNIADVPNGISNATGTIVFSGDRASIQSFSGETGGGRIRLFGFAAFGAGSTIFRVHAAVDAVRIRYPEGVSTVLNSSLNLTGSPDRSMLSGTITVLRATFNPQSDFSSLIAHSAEPVRTPSARTGFVGGLNFDINIETSPDFQVETALTQDVQLEANLHLRGTVTAPALLGRISISQGQVVFFGTRYRISQGSISFYNPLSVEPVLDIDLETKARGIEVTITVSGPLNKLNLSYRSDPPLQFSEIVALLATGRTPTTEAALMTSPNPAAQSFQQLGASALLGQAISSPVSGRLQRFFGVSRLRIDPTLPGVEYNPQARLTLEQQVTQDVTFTYITDVTSTNPLVVSVEWAFAKQWSVVAQRDESGLVGMDIFFKKRFK